MPLARGSSDNADLLGASGWLVLAWAGSFLPVVRDTWIAAAIPLGALLVVPGYTLVAALFPDTHAESGDRTLSATERLLFGVAASVALAMVLGVVLSVSGVGFSRTAALGGVTLSSLGFAGVAAVRRQSGETANSATPGSLVTPSEWRPPARGLTVGLTALAVVAVLWVGALGVGVGGEPLVETYLLTETEGEYVAGGYPTAFEAGQAQPVQVGVENHRGGPVGYTVVVVQQRVATDDPTTVREQRVLDRFGMTVPPGTERIRGHALAPELTGETRVRYLFYEADPPPTVSADTASQHLQLWVTVEDGDPDTEEGA